MKRSLILCAVASLGFAAITLMVTKQMAARHAAQLAEQQAAWEAQKAALEEALAKEIGRRGAAVVSAAAPAPAAAAVRLSPGEIMVRLSALRLAPGADSTGTLREAIYLLEELALAGPAALPEIRKFLAQYVDLELDTSLFRGRNVPNPLPLDFVVPPSLRFGLFQVVRRMGGIEAEEILVEALNRTGRGVEVAYLARVLDQMTPNKYRAESLRVARELLANSAAFSSSSALDRNHRDYLFGVLSLFRDASFTPEAKAQLVRTDQQLERAALNYLQQTLGAQAVPVAAQTYQDPRLTNSAAKEPLARLALVYAGADPQADAFYEQAINDPVLTQSHRQNLIEDLNEEGYADLRNLGERDLPLIQNRLALIERLAPAAMDEANAAGFKEAYKDLVNMRNRILQDAAVSAANSRVKQ